MMAKIFCIVIFLTASFSMQAQKNYATQMQSGTWYQFKQNSLPAQQTMVFKRIDGKTATKEISTFRPNGTIKRCFFEKEGIIPQGGMSCDSNFIYEVKKDLMHISDNGWLHLYYKIKLSENTLELKPVDPQGFYKK